MDTQITLDTLVAEVCEFGTSNDKRLMRTALRQFGYTLRDVAESPWLLPREGEHDFIRIDAAIRAAGANYVKRG